MNVWLILALPIAPAVSRLLFVCLMRGFYANGLFAYWAQIDHEVLLLALKNFLAAPPIHCVALLRAKDRRFTRLDRPSVTGISRGRTTQTLAFTAVSQL